MSKRQEEKDRLARLLDAGEITQEPRIVCSQCGALMPNDAYARLYSRCARHADEEGKTGTSDLSEEK